MQINEKQKALGGRIKTILVWYILPAVFLGTIVKFLGSGIAIPIVILGIAVLGFASLMTYAYRSEISTMYKGLSLTTRRIIWGCGIWLILVLGFVLAFNPFGYMYEENWHTVWKVVFLPPLFLVFGYYSYQRMVKDIKSKQD